MSDPYTSSRPAVAGPGLWKQVRTFGWACLVAGITATNALYAYDRGAHWVWVYGVTAASAVVAALAQGYHLRASLGGGARRGGAAAGPGPRAG